MKNCDVIIIGGGAAGLIAAIAAAEKGAKVIVLEKKPLPGLKLRITGKGRCNITNTAPLEEFIKAFGKQGKFLRQAFYALLPTELIRLFEQLGLQTVNERGGRVFPKSGKAQDVVDALVNRCKELGVKIIKRAEAKRLLVEHGKINGVVVDKSGIEQIYYAKAVIICTGGMSYPDTGSTGDGYKLAAEAGHNIAQLRPSLTPLKIDINFNNLDGLQLKNVNAAFFEKKKIYEDFGEISFIDGCISGPVILTASKFIVPAIDKGKDIILHLDLKPALSNKQLDSRLVRDFISYGKQEIKSVLRKLLPGKIISFILNETGLNGDKRCADITQAERKNIIKYIKNIEIQIIGYGSFREAIVTAGGIKLNEVNPRTMESKLVSGLYFAGEVLDLDAKTGGYNLQMAFSTGWLAGQSCLT